MNQQPTMKMLMRNSKNSTYWPKRNSRRHFCRLAHRSFGLECLENRTVFASDLYPVLNEVDVCFASPEMEFRSKQSKNRTVEVANSQLSLLQGDIIQFEVPESILLQLTDRGSYQLQVFYSENYFSFEPNSLSSGSAVLSGQSGTDDLPSNRALSSQAARP